MSNLFCIFQRAPKKAQPYTILYDSATTANMARPKVMVSILFVIMKCSYNYLFYNTRLQKRL